MQRAAARSEPRLQRLRHSRSGARLLRSRSSTAAVKVGGPARSWMVLLPPALPLADSSPSVTVVTPPTRSAPGRRGVGQRRRQHQQPTHELA
jgi:hypothetical protein